MQLARMLTRMEFRYACLLSLYLSLQLFLRNVLFLGDGSIGLLSAAYGWEAMFQLYKVTFSGLLPVCYFFNSSVTIADSF